MGLNGIGILRIHGQILQILGILMILPVIVALYYGETDCIKAFLRVGILVFIVGNMLYVSMKNVQHTIKLSRRDAYFTTASVWFVISFVSCFPYIIQGCIPNFIDAFFESASGYSTTGASILSDIEALPQSMLFWRSFAHWIGGMGILAFTIALFPEIGTKGSDMLSAETPGPTDERVSSKNSNNAKNLYLIYCIFTATEFVALMITGLSPFDAIIHTFGTVGTGGFSNYNGGVADLNNPAAELVILVFMVLCGVSFVLYLIFISGLTNRNGAYLVGFKKDREFKTYIMLLFVATVAVSACLFISGTYDTISGSLLDGAFQVASIMTTTGFATANYTAWPTFAMVVIFMLFFVGGCSSSTAGGVKVARVLILTKTLKANILSKLHPNAYVQVRVGKRTLGTDIISSCVSFFSLYVFSLMLVTLIVSLDGCSVITALTSAASCLGNIGPGFDTVGPLFNYGAFSGITKLVLSITMLAGRLEIYTFYLLISRRFWNPYRV